MRVAPHNFFGVGVAWGATPTAPIVQSATADASYPPAALYDEQTSPVCKWALLATNYYFNVALNVIPDGDGEQATVPAAWVATGGTITRSAPGTAYKGSYCFVLTPAGLGEASAYCDVTVKAGSYWQIRCATCGSGQRGARFQVIDLERGAAYYLAANGTWTTTPTWLGSTSALAWTATTVTEFRIPTFAEWGRLSGDVRIVLDSPEHYASSSAVYFDEVLLYPSGLDIVAIVGHNFPARSRLRVITWPDYWWGGNFTPVWNDATGRLMQPTGWLYSPQTTITAPYVRIDVRMPNEGTAHRYPQIAEIFLGRTLAFPRSVRPGWQTEWREDQPRAQTGGGVWASRNIQYPVRKMPIELDLEGGVVPEEWPTIRDEVMAATGMGAHPCLLLPAYDVEPDWCLFGNFADNLRLVRTLPHQELSWEFVELPVPLVG